MISVCMTHFKSLGLQNFAAALYSLSQQDFTCVNEVVIVDNNSDDSAGDLQYVVDSVCLPVDVDLVVHKHDDPSRTHAWSTNAAVREARSPWVFFTRSDYLLDPSLLGKLVDVVGGGHGVEWDGFVTSRGRHLMVDVAACEVTQWRKNINVFRGMQGVDIDYSAIDSGVWMARRETFEAVGGLDERLTAWGHAQTHFQHKLHKRGVAFIVIPEVLFFHPMHAGERDITLAHRQLAEVGGDIKDMWKRYEGAQPYR